MELSLHQGVKGGRGGGYCQVYTGRLAGKVCSLSLSKSGAVWHIKVSKCRREVQIIARLEPPPLLLVFSSKHAATGTRSRGVASGLEFF